MKPDFQYRFSGIQSSGERPDKAIAHDLDLPTEIAIMWGQMQIYVSKAGQQFGPYTIDELRYHVLSGNCSAGDLACYDGQNWVTVADVPGLASDDQQEQVQDGTPVQQPPSQAENPSPQNKKVQSNNGPSQRPKARRKTNPRVKAAANPVPRNRPAYQPKEAKKVLSVRDLLIIGTFVGVLAAAGYFAWRYTQEEAPTKEDPMAQAKQANGALDSFGEPTLQEEAEAAALLSLMEIEREQERARLESLEQKIELMEGKLEDSEPGAPIPESPPPADDGTLDEGGIEGLYYQSFDLYQQGNYREAMDRMTKAYEAFEMLEEKVPSTRVRYLRRLCNIAFQLKENEDAIKFAKQITVHSEKEEDKLFAVNRIALTYAQDGVFDKAIEYFEQEKEIRIGTRGPEHPGTVNTFNNLAASYNNQGSKHHNNGEYGKAIEHFEKSLAIKMKSNGPKHPDVISCRRNLSSSHHNLGNTYHGLGQFETAVDHFLKSLEIRQEILGPDHLELAGSHSNLAIVHFESDSHEKAIEHFERALNIRKKHLGPDHPEVKRTETNLTNVKTAANR